MKRALFNIVILLFFFNGFIFSQEILTNCVSTTAPPGNVLPSIGTVNVLVVFAQFPDDNYDIYNSSWPKGDDPSDMNNWINETWTSNPTQGSLTHYFNDMSWDHSANTARFKFTGKTVSVTSPHTRQWYLANSKDRWDIHEEILNSLDATWDFAEFDNWDASRNNNPDGKIDMIIFVWRNIAREFSTQHQIDSVQNNLNFDNDYGSLGFASPTYFQVDGGARRIYANDWGSGVSIRDYVAKGHNETFRVVVHEIAHYLLGNNDYHSGFGFWGMLSAWGYRSIVANSFERSRLGWISPQTVYSSPSQIISNVQLEDYIAIGDAVNMVINSSTNEYFYIENHQLTSYWENTVAPGNIEAGIYVIRKVGSPDGGPSWLQLIPADGRFDWQVNQSVANPWGSGYLPVFKQLAVNKASGYHDDQYLPFSYGGLLSPQPIHFTEQNGVPVVDVRFHGDGKDAFRIGYNQVFSPWSNPNNQRAALDTTHFGFEITNFNNGVCTLNLYVIASSGASPSKPQNILLSRNSGDGYIRVSWDVNTEPDISSYEVSRKIYEYGDNWEVIGNTANNYFVDNDFFYADWAGNFLCTYKVRAKDSQNLYSVNSDEAAIRGEETSKKLIKNKLTNPYNTNIAQNFPNPFNPSTMITYSLKEKDHVTLIVYDFLGKEVARLIDSIQPEGEHSVSFNGSNLPSGVYVYRLKGSNFNISKKMLLIK